MLKINKCLQEPPDFCRVLLERKINSFIGFNTINSSSDNHLTTMYRLSWSTEESIVIRIRADYRNDIKTAFALQSELITPFPDWKRTALNGG